jgi:hypothetical protein
VSAMVGMIRSGMRRIITIKTIKNRLV